MTDAATTRTHRVGRLPALLAVGAVAATGLVATGGTADAEELTRSDSRRDLASGFNLYAVDVEHDAFDVTVSTLHRDLRPRREDVVGGMSVWLDTDHSRRGPEYVLKAPLFNGSDYSVVPTRAGHPWQPQSPEFAVRSTYRMDGRTDSTKLVVPRSAIGRPASVRVAVRVNIPTSDGSRGVDWYRSRFAWTPEVDSSAP